MIYNPGGGGGVSTKFDPLKSCIVYDDFSGNSVSIPPVFLDKYLYYTIEIAVGDFLLNEVVGVANHPGILQGSLLAASGSGGELTLSNQLFGSSSIIFEFSFRFATAAEAGRNFYIGTGTISGIMIPNVGLTFRVNGLGNWFAISRNGGATTAVDTLVLPNLAWHNFRIETNAAGSSAKFFIDGVLVATLVTNLPTTTHGFYMSYLSGGVGITAQNVLCDFQYSEQLVTR